MSPACDRRRVPTHSELVVTVAGLSAELCGVCPLPGPLFGDCPSVWAAQCDPWARQGCERPLRWGTKDPCPLPSLLPDATLRRGEASSSSSAFPTHAVFLSSREIQHITIQDCKNVNSLCYMSSNYSPAARHMCR